MHGRRTFGAFVDSKSSVDVHGRKVLVLASITYHECAAPLRCPLPPRGLPPFRKGEPSALFRQPTLAP